MKDDDKDDIFFKKIASLYSYREGEILKQELEDSEKNINYSTLLDKKIKNRISKIKFKSLTYKLIPIVASIIIAFVYFVTSNKTENNIVKKKNDMEFLSAKMPNGYNITNVAYDKEKTIYYIKNETNNNIVLVSEKSKSEIEKELFKEIDVNNEKVYLLAKKDFNVLLYQKDDVLYSFSSEYNYNDLIELSKGFI